MHPTSLINMKKMLDTILTTEFIGEKCTVIDYGGRKIDNDDSYYSLLKDYRNIKYLSLDIIAGNGVDIVMQDPYHSPLEDNSIDLIISGQMLEHCEFFWLTIQDMARIIRPDGYIALITPSSGQVHRFPVDCWRFYPDAYQALAKWANLELVNAWHDLSGNWKDQVGLLKKCKK